MNALRLQYRITLATLVPLLIFVLLSGVLAAYALRQIPEELVLQRQTELTQVAAAGVAADLRGNIRLLESVSAELAAYTAAPLRQQEIINQRSDVLRIFTGGVVLLDTRGTARASTSDSQDSLGLNYAFRPYFQDCKSSLSPAFSTVLQDKPSQFGAVVIAVPVMQEGEFAGVLAGEFALDRPEWASDLSLLQTPQGGIPYLIDSNGTVIYHPDVERVGSSVRDDPAIASLIVSGKPTSLIERSNLEANNLVTSYAPIPGISWAVITEEPEQAVLAPVIPFQWTIAALMTVGVTLATVALFLSIGRVTRPLNSLTSEARRVAAGMPFRPLQVQGPPDLQLLFSMINRMVTRLEEQAGVIRQYAQQVLKSQEEERLRLARDLHDETVQELIGLNQRLDLCVELVRENPKAAENELRSLQALTGRALVGVQRMSHNLRPSILEDVGLAAALDVLIGELKQQMPGASVSYEIVGEPRRLPAEIELTAFRIAQEALTNIRRHAASATRIDLVLVLAEKALKLIVEDNGGGFDLEQKARVREGHLGLAGMQERARLFNGELETSSEPGEGTIITLSLPIPMDS